LVNVRLGSF